MNLYINYINLIPGYSINISPRAHAYVSEKINTYFRGYAKLKNIKPEYGVWISLMTDRIENKIEVSKVRRDFKRKLHVYTIRISPELSKYFGVKEYTQSLFYGLKQILSTYGISEQEVNQLQLDTEKEILDNPKYVYQLTDTEIQLSNMFAEFKTQLRKENPRMVIK